MTRVNKFDHPGWLPRVLDEMRILIIGVVVLVIVVW